MGPCGPAGTTVDPVRELNRRWAGPLTIHTWHFGVWMAVLVVKLLAWSVSRVYDHGFRLMRPDRVSEGPPSDTEFTSPCRAGAVQYWLGDKTVPISHSECTQPAGAEPGRRIALLALTDPTYLSPQWAAACIPYERAVETALAELRRLPSPPDATILIGALPKADALRPARETIGLAAGLAA